MDATGRGRVFFDADELEVHALAPAPNGGLFVGTSPNGKVYRVDANGRASVFFDPPDPYIWGLAVDRAGNVFAATGDKGLVYKITPDGRGTVFYDTKATHALSLAFDAQARLLVGTGTPGRVFQLDGAGKPFVCSIPSYAEIRALRVDGKRRHLRHRRHRPQRRRRRPRRNRRVDRSRRRPRWPPSPPRSRPSPSGDAPVSVRLQRRPPTGARLAGCRVGRASSGSRPTAAPTWCGRCARTRPTTWPSSPTAA